MNNVYNMLKGGRGAGGGGPHGSEVHNLTYAKFQFATIAAVYKARFTRTASLPIP